MLEIEADIGHEILAQFFGFLNLGRLRASNMQIHRFVGFLASAMFHESASTPLDLNSAAGFLLDVLDIGTALTDHLST